MSVHDPQSPFFKKEWVRLSFKEGPRTFELNVNLGSLPQYEADKWREKFKILQDVIDITERIEES